MFDNFPIPDLSYDASNLTENYSFFIILSFLVPKCLPF